MGACHCLWAVFHISHSNWDFGYQPAHIRVLQLCRREPHRLWGQTHRRSNPALALTRCPPGALREQQATQRAGLSASQLVVTYDRSKNRVTVEASGPLSYQREPPKRSHAPVISKPLLFPLVYKGNQISETYYSAFFLHSFTNKTHWLPENCFGRNTVTCVNLHS